MRHLWLLPAGIVVMANLAWSAEPMKISDEALKIHREALLVDGHNDLPYALREKAELSFQKLDISRPR